MSATIDFNPTPAEMQHPVVFFDGVCGFCSHTVNWLMARDRRHQLRFAPLQGRTAAALLPESLRSSLDTLVFTRQQRHFIRSAAVVRILWQIGGFCAILGTVLWVIPQPIRDLGYRVVSKYRYRLFGRHDACRLPTPEERGRVLE